jgi:hypothetical protein
MATLSKSKAAYKLEHTFSISFTVLSQERKYEELITGEFNSKTLKLF